MPVTYLKFTLFVPLLSVTLMRVISEARTSVRFVSYSYKSKSIVTHISDKGIKGGVELLVVASGSVEVGEVDVSGVVVGVVEASSVEAGGVDTGCVVVGWLGIVDGSVKFCCWRSLSKKSSPSTV